MTDMFKGDDAGLIELKPCRCPFCDGDGIAVTDATRILGNWNLIHRCPVVGALEVTGATREQVIERWNRRPTDDASLVKGPSPDAILGLVAVISHMEARYAAIRKHKQNIDAGKPSPGALNTLHEAVGEYPHLIKQLKAAEFLIESAFEAYEDQRAAARGAGQREAVAWRAFGAGASFLMHDEPKNGVAPGLKVEPLFASPPVGGNPFDQPCHDCGSTEIIGPICATCNPKIEELLGGSGGWRPDREEAATAIGETLVNMNMDIASIVADGSPSADVRAILLDAVDRVLALAPAPSAEAL